MIMHLMKDVFREQSRTSHSAGAGNFTSVQRMKRPPNQRQTSSVLLETLLTQLKIEFFSLGLGGKKQTYLEVKPILVNWEEAFMWYLNTKSKKFYLPRMK
jgi:hypothetical protein